QTTAVADAIPAADAADALAVAESAGAEVLPPADVGTADAQDAAAESVETDPEVLRALEEQAERQRLEQEAAQRKAAEQRRQRQQEEARRKAAAAKPTPASMPVPAMSKAERMNWERARCDRHVSDLFPGW